jgi:nucleoside-diphosphate-sugar epimerase
LAQTIIDFSGKKIQIHHIAGPVGVQSRNFSNERIYSTGWRSRFPLKDGIALTYPWIEEQVRNANKARE